MKLCSITLRNNISILFSTLFVLLNSSVFAVDTIQSVAPISFFTIEEGMPSNEVYDLDVDCYGRIWACTDNGLVSYDGNNFQRYSFEGISPAVMAVNKDPDGNLWFLTLVGEIIRYDCGKDNKPYVFECEGLFEQMRNQVISELHITHKAIYVIFGNKCSIVSNWSDDTKRAIVALNMIQGWDFNMKAHTALLSDLKKQGSEKDREILKTIEAFCDQLNGSYMRPKLSFGEGHRAYLSAGHLFTSNSSGTQVKRKEIDVNPIAVYMEPESGNVWVGSLGQGVHLYSQDLVLLDKALSGHSVTQIIRDQNGNTWFSTLENGIALLNKSAIRQFPVGAMDEWVTSVFAHEDVLWCGTYSGKLFEVSKSALSFQMAQWADFESQVVKIQYNKQPSVSVNGGFYTYYADGEIWKEDSSLETYMFHAVRKTGDSCISVKRKGSFAQTCGKQYQDRVRISFDLGEAGLYYGGVAHAGYLDPYSLSHTSLGNGKRFDLRAACAFKGDTVLLGTKGNGILMAHKGTILGTLECEEYDLSIVLDLENRNGEIWLITPTSFFKVNEIASGKVSCTLWNHFIAAPRVSMKSLFQWGKYLVLATSKHLMFFRPEEVSVTEKAPGIFAMTAKTKKGEYDAFEEMVELSQSDGGIDLYPQAVLFDKSKGIDFRYRILPSDTSWNYASEWPIRLSTLPIGYNTVEVAASTINGAWSDHTALLRVRIFPPFWLSLTFWLPVSILLVLATIPIYRAREKRLKKTLTLEVTAAEYQNRVLSLQLNPHFLFNSINSITAFITNNDIRSTLTYLSRYAKMVRRIFENSSLKLITVQEELTAIEQYIEIESLRLVGKFTYCIHVAEDLDVDELQIPPLMLQPFVENAIWHGIAPLEDETGHLAIEVKNDGARLCITIVDNGRGNSEKQLEHPKSSRLSSLQLIEERFKVLSDLYRATFSWRLSSGPGKRGVVVCIEIPSIINGKVRSK